MPFTKSRVSLFSLITSICLKPCKANKQNRALILALIGASEEFLFYLEVFHLLFS